MRELVPSLEASVQDVLGKLESAYGVSNASSSSAATTSASEASFLSSSSEAPAVASAASSAASAVVSKMSQSPSLDEMKQRMGKLFQRQQLPPGEQQAKTPFWKKS